MPSGIYKHKSHQLFQKGHKTNVGRKASMEIRTKLSLAKKGKPLSEKHKKALSENHADITREKHPRWTGGSRGYYNYSARKVMEQYLRRTLLSTEVIHHLDHNWKNNGIDNLHVFSNSSEHSKYHWFLRSIVREELNAQ